jgi:hypothetical protein
MSTKDSSLDDVIDAYKSGIDVMAPFAVWGFLVGFVAWIGCFRLVEPVTDWLIGAPDSAKLALVIVVRLVQ